MKPVLTSKQRKHITFASQQSKLFLSKPVPMLTQENSHDCLACWLEINTCSVQVKRTQTQPIHDMLVNGAKALRSGYVSLVP